MAEVSGKKLILALAAAGALLIAAIVYAFVSWGQAPLERASRLREARARTKALASAIAACATGHGLPASGEPGLTCSKVVGPEAATTGFRFDWEKLSDARGVARAEGDPTGEGKLHVALRVVVACRGAGPETTCDAGELEEASF